MPESMRDRSALPAALQGRRNSASGASRIKSDDW